MRQAVFVCLFALFSSLWAHPLLMAQPSPDLIDSLQNRLKADLSDKERVETLNLLATNIWDSMPSQAKLYLEEALSLSEKIDYVEGIAITYDKLGYAHSEESNAVEALRCYKEALAYYEQLDALAEQADVLNQIGRIYDVQGAYTKALEKYLASQRISEKLRDTNRLAVIRGNIGIIYSQLGDEDKALALFAQSLRNHQASGNELEQATTYINMGVSHQKIGNMSAAESNYGKALDIFAAHNDRKGQAFAYGNLGDVLMLQSDVEEALRYYQKSRQFFEQLNNQEGLAMSDTQIGIAHLLLDQFKEAEKYLTVGLRQAERIGSKDIQKNAQYYLSQCFEFQGDYKKALRHFQYFEQLKEELLGLEKSRAVAEVQAQYQLQKREEEYQQKEVEQRQEHQNELEQRNMVIMGTALMTIVVLIFSILQFFSIREKKRINQTLEVQRDQITRQRDVLEEKSDELQHRNVQISKSIEAAKTIQNAILPPTEKMQGYFKDHFKLYRPKDVVSGDMFWVGKVEKRCYLAMVDCTGHGVPGAFMSLVGNTLLDKIVLLQRVKDPGQVLERLHEEVYQSLHQRESGENSGMDVALVCISPKEEAEDGYWVDFAGAKRPLWYVSGGKWNELQGDRRGIGGQRPVKTAFTTQRFSLQEGDIMYLFSDGYTDQHDDRRRKFGTQKFRKLLQELAGKFPMERQGIALEAALDVHKGKQEQRDDILVLGVRV